MRNVCIGVMLLASVSHVWGQQSLTITASRSIALQPDQVVFSVNVTSGLSTGLDDVTAALAGSGITAANLVTLNTADMTLYWIFDLAEPLSKMKDTIGSLTAAQGAIGQNNSGLSLTFNVQGTQVSPQLQASQQCPIPDMIADARAQAQNIAASSGVTVGPILALSDGSAGIPVYSLVIPAFNVGSFVSFLAGTPVNCTVVVKFGVVSSQ